MEFIYEQEKIHYLYEDGKEKYVPCHSSIDKPHDASRWSFGLLNGTKGWSWLGQLIDMTFVPFKSFYILFSFIAYIILLKINMEK